MQVEIPVSTILSLLQRQSQLALAAVNSVNNNLAATTSSLLSTSACPPQLQTFSLPSHHNVPAAVIPPWSSPADSNDSPPQPLGVSSSSIKNLSATKLPPQQHQQKQSFLTFDNNVNSSQPTSSDATSLAAQVKAEFVDGLVDTAACILESIWPIQPTQSTSSTAKLLPLRLFIQEILRRSRTSFCTLQLALLYIVRLKQCLSSQQLAGSVAAMPSATAIPSSSAPLSPSSPTTSPTQRPHHACARRALLSALIVASKFLQDRNYSNKAWSRISGLPLTEINTSEMEFLKGLDWDLYVSQRTFAAWSAKLVTRARQVKSTTPGTPGTSMAAAVTADSAAVTATVAASSSAQQQTKPRSLSIASIAAMAPRRCAGGLPCNNSNAASAYSAYPTPSPPLSASSSVRLTLPSSLVPSASTLSELSCSSPSMPSSSASAMSSFAAMDVMTGCEAASRAALGSFVVSSPEQTTLASDAFDGQTPSFGGSAVKLAEVVSGWGSSNSLSGRQAVMAALGALGKRKVASTFDGEDDADEAGVVPCERVVASAKRVCRK